MNLTRQIYARLKPWGVLLGALWAFSCIQGPWDYEPENKTVYRGLFLSGYLIGGRPVTNVCVEKMLDLDEYYTNAFPFYQEQEMVIYGEFSGAQGQITLTPDPGRANCFTGPDDALPLPGESYQIEGRIAWDSAGTRVETRFEAIAEVPEMFSIRDTAFAPGMALAGGLNSSDGADTLAGPQAILEGLPQGARDELVDIYGDTLIKLEAEGDSAVVEFLIENTAEIIRIISKYNVDYQNGDTLYYMTGLLNTVSHYFKAYRSDDVGAVLVTLRWDTLEAKPETRFDSIFGFTPDTADFFREGNQSRLLVYPDAEGGGWALLDSMGFVNTWFYTGLNRIFFYGLEDDYFDYTENTVQNESNSKVPPYYNVTGAAGLFVGGLVDSFDVYIKTDTFTTVYSLPAAMREFCAEGGGGPGEENDIVPWTDSPYCRLNYSGYCESVHWEDPDCVRDYLKRFGQDSLDLDDLADSLEWGKEEVEDLLTRVEREKCVESGFADEANCSAFFEDCMSPGMEAAQLTCKGYQWNWCEDRKWLPEDGAPSGVCAPALATFCRDNNINSNVLCSKAETFCEENPNHLACQ